MIGRRYLIVNGESKKKKEDKMDAIKQDGLYYCPECKSKLPEENHINISSPEGILPCLTLCHCEKCDINICCRRKELDLSLLPKTKKKKLSSPS